MAEDYAFLLREYHWDGLKHAVEEGSKRYIFDLYKLMKLSPECKKMFNEAYPYINNFKQAFDSLVRAIAPDRNLNFGFTPKHLKITPRGIRGEHLNTMITVIGVVSEVSDIHSKLESAIFLGEDGKFSQRQFYGDLSIMPLASTPATFVSRKDFGNIVLTNSKFTKKQTMILQETTDSCPAGQTPNRVTVILEDDLVERHKLGDVVEVVGILMGESTNFTRSCSLLLDTSILANNIISHNQINTRKSPNEENIHKELENVNLDRLSASLAPSVHGHIDLKKALILSLIGGADFELSDQFRRGSNIHILMIGDPSTAKSQLIRSASRIATSGVLTTGHSSSGPGLSACVSTDLETNIKRIVAGAAVLADGGTLFIDEFDKLDDTSMIGLHEIMAQGTASICKAGMKIRMNAKCTVVAAANPPGGTFKRDGELGNMLGIRESLLSRFDLIFQIFDKPDPELDAMKASHVVDNHIAALHCTLDEEDSITDQMYNPDNNIIHPEVLKGIIELLSQSKTEMTTEANDLIVGEYIRARAMDHVKGSKPITLRYAAGLKKLSEAHAKLRLSSFVEKVDCEVAISLANVCTSSILNVDSPAEEICMSPYMHSPGTCNIEDLSMHIPNFIELITDMSSQMYGAEVIDVDCIYQRAHEQLNLTPAESTTIIKSLTQFSLINGSLYILKDK